MQPPPTPRLLLRCIVLSLLRFGPVGVTVGWDDDDCELCVGEDGPAVVEEVIGSEFHTGADYPAKGSEVVVDGVGYHEGIIGL